MAQESFHAVRPTGPEIPEGGTDTVPEPDRTPQPGPAGPRTPYPVDDPGVLDPRPGSAPDVNPGRPLGPGTHF